MFLSKCFMDAGDCLNVLFEICPLFHFDHICLFHFSTLGFN